MNKTTIGLSLLALGLAGVAYADAAAPGGDPMGDKTVTRAEFIAQHVQMFDKMDTNHDGKIDDADRAAHMGEMFDMIDTDHNGSISREEFNAAHQKMGGPGGEHGGKHRMRGGPDGDHGRMGMMMLKMADTNNDGVVTKDEFVAAAGKQFDMMDTNHDGKLTSDERKAAHQKTGGMRHGGGGRGGHPMGDMPPPPPPAN